MVLSRQHRSDRCPYSFQHVSREIMNVEDKIAKLARLEKNYIKLLEI